MTTRRDRPLPSTIFDLPPRVRNRAPYLRNAWRFSAMYFLYSSRSVTSKAVFRSHGSDLLIFGEASADPIRTRGYAARRSADRCAAQAQGMSSSRREAGQRLTSLVSTSAKQAWRATPRKFE